MSLPFKAVIPAGLGLALAGCLWWWYTSRSSKPETKDGAISTVQLSELTEKDEQCARSISTRAPVSDSLDEVQDIVESCEDIEQLQDPVTCQDEPEILDIGQPDLSSEGVDELHELQDPVNCQDEPEIVDIGQPDLSNEGVEELHELQEPSTCQDKPKIVGIIRPKPSFEKIEEIHGVWTCKEEPDMEEIPSSLEELAKIVDLSTLMSEKPFFPKCPQRPPLSKRPRGSFGQLVWEARVPRYLIWRFIGDEGCQVKSLIKESGAKIHVKTLTCFEELRIIHVTGTLKQIVKAAAMIKEWFKTFEVDLPFYTIKRAPIPWR